MPVLVHIAPANKANLIRRNGIAARKLHPDAGPGFDRLVWAFPVLPSYTLTHSWSRELKRTGATSLVAATFRIADDEPVLASHFSQRPAQMTAAEAAGFIASAEDPRGYEIMVPRRIASSEIIRIRPLPKAVGWRYYPEAKGKPAMMCDCPMCCHPGEVKSRRYRDRVRARLRANGLMTMPEMEGR